MSTAETVLQPGSTLKTLGDIRDLPLRTQVSLKNRLENGIVRPENAGLVKTVGFTAAGLVAKGVKAYLISKGAIPFPHDSMPKHRA